MTHESRASQSESFRAELGRFRRYLILLAEAKLSPALRVKISSSDIVQETLLQAYEHCDQFQGKTEAELAAWLRQILLRQLIDALRKFRSQARDIARERSLDVEVESSSQQLERWLASEEASPSKLMQHQEDLIRLADALALLPEDQRVVVDLKHLQGWSVAQICRHLNKTEAAVAGLLRRGLRQLRESLTANETKHE